MNLYRKKLSVDDLSAYSHLLQLGSFPFHLADQNRIKCVFFILISIHLLLLHLHQVSKGNDFRHIVLTT